MRAMWKGIISFGPVSVPVKLYAAIESVRVNFHLLHDQDNERLKQQMVCLLEDRPVERDEMVKGYEVDRDEYVIVEADELEAAAPSSGRMIEVRQFVNAEELDARYYDRPYYLGPDGSEAGFAALAAALGREKLVGVCRWVMRKKSYVGALRAMDGGRGLSLISMHYADELVPVGSLELPRVKLDKRELEVANYLIETLAADWDASRYVNDYDQQVHELIERKARGEQVEVHRHRRPRSTRSDRLLETLEASVKAASRGRRGGGGRRKASNAGQK